LGSLAALAFAAIGFVVSATASVTERLGEFALLQAVGLSARQLATWVSLENAFLLAFGLVSGSALGLLLSWLVLPFATLTESGATPVPTPVVEIPWVALLPLYLLAGVVLFVVLVVITSRLPRTQLGGVLRARDE
jgi:ABC-type antimicrobial peptide transport system permease subunit